MSVSHFDEKSGIVPSETPWGSWWQTVAEIFITIDLPKNTRSKDVKVVFTPNNIDCKVLNETVLKGQLFKTVYQDDCVWTIEDGCILNIILYKAEYEAKDTIWEALLKDGSYKPDPVVLMEMRKKLDLEKFQMENPGMDFSRAKLSKCYDQPPV